MTNLLNSFGFDLSNVNKLLDPDNVDKQLKYYKNGLTYVSNNTSVIPRDEAGNIILNENSTTNPLLIIEPTSNKIITTSLLRVIDTQFKYFKFPARTNVIQEEPVDVNLDLDFNLQQDAVFARYRPSDDQRIPYGTIYSGIEMSEVQDGLTQQKPNSYVISKQIKNSGVDLRFRIKLQHRYDALTGYGVAYFSLIKSGEEGLDRSFKAPFSNTSELHPTIPGSINQYEVQNLEIDIVISNSEFEIGDAFSIGAYAFTRQPNDTQYHTINALQSYWVISDASKNVDLWNQEINA